MSDDLIATLEQVINSELEESIQQNIRGYYKTCLHCR